MGQPILAAAGFQPALAEIGDSHSRLKGGCRHASHHPWIVRLPEFPGRHVGQDCRGTPWVRRIFNPPAALGCAHHNRGESPTPFAACRHVGQDCILRVGFQPALDGLPTRRTQRVPLPICPTILARQSCRPHTSAAHVSWALQAGYAPPLRRALPAPGAEVARPACWHSSWLPASR